MDGKHGLRAAWSVPIRLLAALLVLAGAGLCQLIILQGVFEPFHVVHSGSMAPGIATGDAVVVREADAGKLKVGEVIVFRDWDNKENLVVHRVVGIEDMGYTRYFSTKGDANPEPDPVRITPGSIVGVCWARVPRFGYLMEDLVSPMGFVFFVLVPVVGGFCLALAHDLAERAVLRRHRRRRFHPMPTAA